MSLVLTLLANIIDTFSTLWATSVGYKELNPIMKVVLDYDWRLFVAIKLVIVSLLFWFLHRQKSRYAWRAASVPYMGLAVYQILGYVWWTFHR